MAGRPFLRALDQRIEQFGIAAHGADVEGTDMTPGELWFFDQVADGLSLQKIAAKCGVSRRQLYFWMDMDGQKERRRGLLAESREWSAEAHADKAGEILEGVGEFDEDGRRIPLSAPEVALAKERSGYRRWLAGVRDPGQYGDKRGQVNVNLSVGELHLDALMAHGRMPQIEGGPVVDEPDLVEVEDDDVLGALMGGS